MIGTSFCVTSTTSTSGGAASAVFRLSHPAANVNAIIARTNEAALKDVDDGETDTRWCRVSGTKPPRSISWPEHKRNLTNDWILLETFTSCSKPIRPRTELE